MVPTERFELPTFGLQKFTQMFIECLSMTTNDMKS